MHCWPVQTAFTAALKRTHRPSRHPPLDKQCRSAIIMSTTSFAALKNPNRQPVGDRVPPCRPPHANNTELQFRVTTVASDIWPLQCLSWHHPPDDHLHRRLSWQLAAWVVVLVAGTDLTVMSLHSAYYFAYKVYIGDLPTPMCYHAASCNVADFRCPMCTSAEL